MVISKAIWNTTNTKKYKDHKKNLLCFQFVVYFVKNFVSVMFLLFGF